MQEPDRQKIGWKFVGSAIFVCIVLILWAGLDAQNMIDKANARTVAANARAAAWKSRFIHSQQSLTEARAEVDMRRADEANLLHALDKANAAYEHEKEDRTIIEAELSQCRENSKENAAYRGLFHIVARRNAEAYCVGLWKNWVSKDAPMPEILIRKYNGEMAQCVNARVANIRQEKTK